MGWIVNGKYVPDIIRGDNTFDRSVAIGQNAVKKELFDDYGISIKKSNKKDSGVPSDAPNEIFGYDNSNVRNNIIRYADNVTEEEKIPGLIDFLEQERKKIIDFAQSLLGYSESFNWNYLGKIWEMPIILCKETPNKTYEIIKSNDRLEKEINNVYKIIENRDEIKIKVIKILESRYRTTTERILGKYFQNGWRHIELYYKNFDEKDCERYKALIANTLAHEIFHAIHHLIIGKNFEYSGDESERVIEATADFFAFAYSWRQGAAAAKKIAEERFDTWKDRISDGWWPYAFAIYFFRDFDICNHNIEKFVEVIIKSKISTMDVAFDAMVNY